MNIQAFIESGILTNYCLGFCTPEEVATIELLAARHAAIKNEIGFLRKIFEEQLIANAIEPSAKVKGHLMRSVYKQEAITRPEFAPLIDDSITTQQLTDWASINNIKLPTENFENLHITELPSTEQVVNFIVAAKKGHEPEVHEDLIEYLFVIEGSCTMNFNGAERSYNAGDIITIPPHVNHSAVVTSLQPMLALVQRQIFI